MHTDDSLDRKRAALSPTKRALLFKLLEKKGASEKVLIPRLNQVRAPLSIAQSRLWFLDQLEPGNSAYVSVAIRLEGVLDVVLLEQSINKIISRHESLRTRFEVVEGEPLQVIGESLTLQLPIVDVSKLGKDQKQLEIEKIYSQASQSPFDLGQGPLIRMNLVKLQEQEHVLFVTTHNIVSDGWSMGVFAHELGALYGAIGKGEILALEELPIQYADYAVWQRQNLEGGVLDKELQYWKKQLEGAPSVLQLPTDWPRPLVRTNRVARKLIQIGEGLSQGLTDLSRREGVTLFMTLLAGMLALIYRYTGQEDLSLGTLIAGRNRVELERLIGHCVNALVLRTDLSNNPSFRQILKRVRDVALGAYAHQDLPFEKLVEELKPERDLSYTPLIQVMVVLQNNPIIGLELSGLNLQAEIENRMTEYDLTLTLAERDRKLICSMDYSTDLFNDETIKDMLKNYQYLLSEVSANPELLLSELHPSRSPDSSKLSVEPEHGALEKGNQEKLSLS